jgi:NADH:ubiquinone reductase (H+-translocating)
VSSEDDQRHHVIVVGGGFAGLGCAVKLADHDDIRVTLIDRNNYHQFTPMLYQVATSQVAATDIANSLREVFSEQDNVDVKLADIVSVDTASRTVRSSDGEEWSGDALVVAAGSEANFFGTPGADKNAFPLYSLDDATRLRSRILALFEHVDRDPGLLQRGALNFVVVGGGATGVEVAGALADMINITLPAEYEDLDHTAAHVHILDFGDALLKPFSDKAHTYVSKVLTEKGVSIHLGTGVKEVATGHAVLSDGSMFATRCVVWGGGLKAAPLASSGGLPQGRGGRIDVESDLTLAGTERVYVVGDVANIRDGDGGDMLPQLGSVALQSGQRAAENIVADFKGEPRKSFEYKDKGIMAMIGRGAAIAEVGKNHHEVHGQLAHMAWLGVHASLMTGARAKIEAIIDWSWDRFSKAGGPHVLDRGDAAQIDWDDDDAVNGAASFGPDEKTAAAAAPTPKS